MIICLNPVLRNQLKTYKYFNSNINRLTLYKEVSSKVDIGVPLKRISLRDSYVPAVGCHDWFLDQLSFTAENIR